MPKYSDKNRYKIDENDCFCCDCCLYVCDNCYIKTNGETRDNFKWIPVGER